MATKLYPPRLEGTLPAFYKSYDDDNSYISTGANITIPFGRNPAVNSTEVGGVTLRLRTVSTNSYIITDLEASSFDMDKCLATFLLPNDKTSDDMKVSIIEHRQLSKHQMVLQAIILLLVLLNVLLNQM